MPDVPRPAPPQARSHAGLTSSAVRLLLRHVRGDRDYLELAGLAGADLVDGARPSRLWVDRTTGALWELIDATREHGGSWQRVCLLPTPALAARGGSPAGCHWATTADRRLVLEVLVSAEALEIQAIPLGRADLRQVRRMGAAWWAQCVEAQRARR